MSLKESFRNYCKDYGYAINKSHERVIDEIFSYLNNDNVVLFVKLPSNTGKTDLSILLSGFLRSNNKETLLYMPWYDERRASLPLLTENKNLHSQIIQANTATVFDYRNKKFDYIIVDELVYTDISKVSEEERISFISFLKQKDSNVSEIGTRFPNAQSIFEDVGQRILTHILVNSRGKAIIFVNPRDLPYYKKTTFLRSGKKTIVDIYQAFDKDNTTTGITENRKMDSRRSRNGVVDMNSTFNMLKGMYQKIDSQNDIIIDLKNQVTKIDERSERMESTINEIDKKIGELSGQIGAFQSLVERQLEIADSDIEKDKIIQGYVDECVDRIVKTTNSNTEKRALEIEQKKLISSLGDAAWDKLDEKSKTFLISAKIMYNHLILLDDQTDYSGVCVLVTKALEVEMSRRFYFDFLKYLDKKYKKHYSKYHSALLYDNKPLRPDKFTMGSIAFAMCFYENKKDSSEKKQQNKNCLLDYARNVLFPGKSDTTINKMLTEYADAIETIRRTYRNPSAHTDELHKIDAENCFNLVLDVEKLMKKMIDSFAE